MESTNIIDTVVVFTSSNMEDLLQEGGSGWWVLDKDRAEKMKYVVCVQNTNGPKHFDGKKYSDQNTAFVVGKLSGVLSSYHDGKERFLLQFSEYAEIEIANKWDGSRNPVRYVNLEDFLGNYKFEYKKMHKVEDNVQPLSLEEAKQRLATTLGVKVEQISITIHA